MNVSDTVIVASIAAIPGILTVILSLHNRDAIHEVHVSLNSRLDQLLKASVAEGRIAERTEQRAVDVVIPENPPAGGTG